MIFITVTIITVTIITVTLITMSVADRCQERVGPFEQVGGPLIRRAIRPGAAARIAGEESATTMLTVDGLPEQGHVDLEAATADRAGLMVCAGVLHGMVLPKQSVSTRDFDSARQARSNASLR